MQRPCLAVRRAPRRARTLPDLLTPISEPSRLREHVPWRKFYRNAHGGAGRALLARSGSRHLAHKSLASCFDESRAWNYASNRYSAFRVGAVQFFDNPAQPCAGFAGYPAGTLQEFAAGYPAPGDQPWFVPFCAGPCRHPEQLSHSTFLLKHPPSRAAPLPVLHLKFSSGLPTRRPKIALQPANNGGAV